MNVLSRPTIISFYEKHSDAKTPLEKWYHDAKKAKWSTPQDIKEKYNSVSFLDNNLVVFNIKGNKYRLVVSVAYPQQKVFIKFIGTHKEYDKQNFE